MKYSFASKLPSPCAQLLVLREVPLMYCTVTPEFPPCVWFFEFVIRTRMAVTVPTSACVAALYTVADLNTAGYFFARRVTSLS